MFLLSLSLAYFSSVEMFISVPASIGMSSSPRVFPVLISGPFCKRSTSAMSQMGRRKAENREAYSVKCNSNRSAFLDLLSLFGIVDDRLVILSHTSLS